ncbi:pre-mRNA-splicing factor clf1-like [Salvia miltiorrhiza]|uniref:pre-mRNA-splicing factor clf1-like n=1 Tax=Salvia miltiorrhiza TaxID=226208 RepID=UPI0025AD9507|nr:pre-mRNA-splicing factor clf1-like [Salvia miltiorrhiza]
MKKPTLTRHRTFDPNPVSTNKLQSSLAETERTRALFALAFDSPALDMPHLLWKTYSEFEISEAEYERSKALYEMLLERTKRLKLWISYAQFEAFAMIKVVDLADKRKCVERARDVFERGLSYFRSCGPEMKEERATLLEEWLEMENRFGDVELVRGKLAPKLKKRN